MNEQRTYLRGGVHISRPGASTAGGLSRHVLYPAVTVLPGLALCAIGLVGLLIILSPVGVCAAAESGNSTGNAGAQGASAPAGIRNPLNPHEYMNELAGRLNPSSDKQLLLRGVPQDRAASQKEPATAQMPGNSWFTPSAPIVSAQVFAGNPDGQKAQAADKDDATPQRFMSFWNDPALNGPSAQQLGPAGAIEARGAEERVIKTATIRNRPVRTVPNNSREVILGSLGIALDSMKPGVVLAGQESPANIGATVPADEATQAKASGAKGDKKRWSAGEDLDKYRAHAVKEGSRDSGQNIKKAFERAGLTLEDGVNVFVLGYASPRGELFRKNDGKGLLDEPGKVPEQAGAAVGSAGLGLYSVADLILLNGLPDPDAAPYLDNHPVVRPLLFTGQMIGGVWKTTEEMGNAVTWGYFDNVTGCIGMCIEDILELLKHTGEAVTNLARVPVGLVAGNHEGTQRAMDWVLLVPLEFISNSVQMKGIANMQDYKTAFEDKGVIGSVIELGGSSFLVYRGTKELVDKLDDKHHRRCRTADSSGDGVTPDTPSDPPIPEPLPPDQIFLLDGTWPIENLENGTGVVLIDGDWASFALKTWRE